MSYYNEHFDELEELDFDEAEEQIQRENDFYFYCDSMKKVHEEMREYAKYSAYPCLMEFSNYFDLMDLVQKEKYEFTTTEKKLFIRSNSYKQHDNIDLTYLFHTFDLNPEISVEIKTLPKPQSKHKKNTKNRKKIF